jgi:hypothetical protein
VTALESFHGAAHEYCLKCGAVRQQRKAWRESVLAALPNTVAPAPYQWVQSVLGSSLGPSLRVRHEELYDDAGHPDTAGYWLPDGWERSARGINWVV